MLSSARAAVAAGPLGNAPAPFEGRVSRGWRATFGALVATAGTMAQAAVFTVGTPVGAGQCTHGTIQSAFNAAESSAGADTVRLTRSLTYEPEANSINTSQELTVEGGYATCTQAATDGLKTVVSGAGGATEPVFRITVNTGGIVRLRLLTISGGDEDGAGRGGGIYFRGNGVLEVRDSVISNNLAGNGGGIYAEGTGSDTELVIGANVGISNNTARFDGGGIVADQVEMSMLEPGSILLGNEAIGAGGAGGYGGGLYIVARDRSSYAYVGSGAPVFGPIWGNTARYGGGVAIGGASSNIFDTEFAELLLYTTVAGQPATVLNNTASVAGGGVHLRPFTSSFDGRVITSAQFWNASIDGNAAPDGAAIFFQGDAGSFLAGSTYGGTYFNVGTAPAGAIACVQGAECGGVRGNRAVDTNNQPTSGAVVRLSDGGEFFTGSDAPNDPLPRGGVRISGNSGGYLIRGNGTPFRQTRLQNALVTGNQSSQLLVRSDGDTRLEVIDTTITDNAIGASPLLSTNGTAVTVARSILWQPGAIMLGRSGGSQSVADVIASENASLGGSPGAIQAAPRFIDPANADYRLRAASAAVDYAPPVVGDDRDAFSLPRDQDLPVKVNVFGVRDVGAFERPALLPLVLNADFDFSDLRLWTRFAGAWDGTQNVAGGSGSGSWAYSGTGLNVPRVELGRQCIHLPGPATYRLNGRGRGGGSTIATRDFAVLAWEFRRTGFEACNAGAPDATGELTVGAGTNWGTAGTPTLIDVLPGDWTTTSSITITLVAVDGGVTSPRSISAFFDGIVLEIPGGDALFGDGFECPAAAPGAGDSEAHDAQGGAATGDQQPLGQNC